MRRTVPVALVFAGMLVALTAPSALAAHGFKYGVTAAEVTSNSALVWARPNKAGGYTAQVSTNRHFSSGVKTRHVKASKSQDLTIQTTFKGLKPNKQYFYRFKGKGATSDTGRFHTALSPKSKATVKFAWTGDEDAQPAVGSTKPFFGPMTTFGTMAKEKNLFSINLGDTIYSDSEVPNEGTLATTVAQKWAKYKQNLATKNYQRIREASGMYNEWDDHEFQNDFSKAEFGNAIYAAGVKAFRDYMPTTFKSSTGLYRTFRWGKNVELFFLDERSFRDAKAVTNGVCNNPDTNAPDLAPTAPQRVRNVFAAITPSLAQPVSQACLDEIRSPNRTFLGANQLNDFMKRLKGSKAKFKVIMNETPIQQFYALPYDRWEGYEAERQGLLKYIQANVKNVVFLTTDTHANLYNDARLATFPEEGGPTDSGIKEMVTGPVATMTFAKEIDGAAGRQGAGDLITSAFLKQPPPNGPGMLCAATDVFSYTEVKVTSKAVTLTPKDLNGKPVTEKGDGNPRCGPFTIPAK